MRTHRLWAAGILPLLFALVLGACGSPAAAPPSRSAGGQPIRIGIKGAIDRGLLQPPNSVGQYHSFSIACLAAFTAVVSVFHSLKAVVGNRDITRLTVGHFPSL